MKVVCTTPGRDDWYNDIKIFGIKIWRNWVKGPDKDEIVTVVGEEWVQGEKYYRFLEWPGEEYDAIHFKPLQESATEYSEVTFTEIKKEVPVSAN